MTTAGILDGIRVIEMAGLGPAPYCGQLLADLGAEVIIIDRPNRPTPYMIDGRGKKSIALDLKNPDAVAATLKLIETADVLIEGYRPGVMERRGIGPNTCQKLNPKLVYGRMTGWGQSGPWSTTAGHDINYLSITGFMHLIGKKDEAPAPPLNLVGDYGGGSLFLALGILSALLKAQKTGKGDVVDAAIIDGVSSMMGIVHSVKSFGRWSEKREDNVLDGGAPFYRCYKTKDEKFMAIGCIEAKFFALMLDILQVSPDIYGNQNDKTDWPRQHQLLESVYASKTRDEWAELFSGTDACVTPVLDLAEAQDHPHNQARVSHQSYNGMSHPQIAPRFEGMELNTPKEITQAGEHTVEILKSIGLDNSTIANLT